MSLETGENPTLKIDEIWDRLRSVSQKLWQENSPVSVSLEAIVEEFRSEVRRIGQGLVSSQKLIAEQRDKISKEYFELYSDRIREFETKISRAEARIATLETNLTGREDEVKKLLKSLADKEAENVKFHESYLVSTSHSDQLQAKKIEGLYQDLKKKETEMEASWEGRRKALEDDYAQKAEAVKKKEAELANEWKTRNHQGSAQFAEMDRELREFQKRLLQEKQEWESQKLKEQEGILHKDEELKKQTQDLLAEYKRKQDEMRRIKEGMQAEISELVRQYQARLKTQSPASSSQ